MQPANSNVPGFGESLEDYIALESNHTDFELGDSFDDYIANEYNYELKTNPWVQTLKSHLSSRDVVYNFISFANTEDFYKRHDHWPSDFMNEKLGTEFNSKEDTQPLSENTTPHNKRPNTVPADKQQASGNQQNSINLQPEAQNMEQVANDQPNSNDDDIKLTKKDNKCPSEKKRKQGNKCKGRSKAKKQPKLTEEIKLKAKKIRSKYAKIKPYQIQKNVHNFGMCAIGGYMRERKNFYYMFLRKKLKRDMDFIKKLHSRPISYTEFKDFKKVCECTQFLENCPKNLENNLNFALRKMTLKFLKKDAYKWIKYKVKEEEYKPLYKDILRAYIREFRKGGDFNFKEFGSFKLE